MTPTHVEFEDENKFTHIVRVGSFGLHRTPSGQWHAVAGAVLAVPGSDMAWPIDEGTAARLRRELLGEPEAASVPAAEPEFVLARLGMFAPNGICTTTYPLADRELAERSCAYNGSGWSVVPLYIRREDARP